MRKRYYSVISQDILKCTTILKDILFEMQVKFMHSAIGAVQRSSALHGLPHVSDPCDGIVEVLIKCMEWYRRVIPESELPKVQ